MLKLCLTGGPGSGKTVIFNHLAQILEEHGYFVFYVSDTVSELMMNGIRPNSHISTVAFYNFVLDKQLEKEKIYSNLDKYYPKDKLVIVYDKGLLDIAAEIDPAAFEGMLQRRRMSVLDACEHYDAVVHLVTAAESAEKYYQWNDPAQFSNLSNLAVESPDMAIAKDKKIQNAWDPHFARYIVPSTERFRDKIKTVVEIVFELLQVPAPKHNRRQFLIKKPTETDIKDLQCTFRGNIIQTYLKSQNPSIYRHLVQRGSKDSGFSFYYIETVAIGDDEEAFVTEKRIDAQEYARLMSERDESFNQIAKSRFCFVYKNKYYDIDLFSFDNEHAILDIEADEEKPNFTPFNVVKEITGDSAYDDRELAQKTSPVLNESSTQSVPIDQSDWVYETGREERGIGKDDIRIYSVEVAHDESLAIRLFSERGRTYLLRSRYLDGKRYVQWYDKHSHIWMNE